TRPDHPAIRYAADHDFVRFAEAESSDRRVHGYPPWRRLLRVLVRGPTEEAVAVRAGETAARLRRGVEAPGEI
ncbi:MAG: primosomal protein N', partial [Planctomycetota bacterium]